MLEIENNAVGTKRVQPQDIIDAFNVFANAVVLQKQPVLRHFMGEEE